jgi:hypothetical protein
MRRALTFCALLVLAGCSGSPGDLGITGPTAPTPPLTLPEGTVDNPGLPDPGASYGPSVTPSTGTGRYYNYN